MKVRAKYEHHICFDAEEGDQLVVAYDNRGEPYREGISLTMHEPDKPYRSYVFLDKREAHKLRDLIDVLFPRRTQAVTSTNRGCDMSDQHEAMREIGPLTDPIQEALRRMIAEFGDEHYHTCPADNDSGPCDCFAGHLIRDVRRILDESLAVSPADRGGAA